MQYHAELNELREIRGGMIIHAKISTKFYHFYFRNFEYWVCHIYFFCMLVPLLYILYVGSMVRSMWYFFDFLYFIDQIV